MPRSQRPPLTPTLLLLYLAAALLPAGPSGAQGEKSVKTVRATPAGETTAVLVTLDGEKIALGGPWEQRGRRVIYTDQKGRLSSISADAIDFEATARAAEPPLPAAPQEEEATRAPILVLDASNTPTFEQAPPPVVPGAGKVEGTTTRTKRVSKSEDEPDESETAANESGDRSTTASGTDADDGKRRSRGIRVANWQDLSSEENTAIWGSVENQSGLPAAEIVIELQLVAQDGTLLAKDIAVPDNNRLLPGEKSNFNLQLPGLVAYHDIEFEITYDELRPRGQ